MSGKASMLRRIACMIAGTFVMLLAFAGSRLHEVLPDGPSAVPIGSIRYWELPRYYIPQVPLAQPLQKYTFDLCRSEGVDYELALAVMWNESRFDTRAVNVNVDGSQDSGLMQINDVNAKWIEQELGVDNLFDAKQNILVGVTLLARFVREYGEYDGLMAYNLGEAGMIRAKENGVYSLDFVNRLLDKRDMFDQMRKFT